MNVLVTGGAGFLGSHVVDLLIENKHNVVIVDDLSHGVKENINTQATFYKRDIVSAGLEEIFEKHKIEEVIHLAAQINARAQDPFPDANTNIIGSLKILEASRMYNAKVVYASSVAVYGEPRYLPVDENHPSNPINYYGVSKHTVEHYLHVYNKAYNLDYVILRFTNIYGPRQDPKGEAGVISIFINNLLQGRPVSIFGDGKQTRDFVFVKDAAMAAMLALDSGSERTINIGLNKEVSVNEVYRTLQESLELKVEAKYVKGLPEIEHMRVDSRLAERELSWKPNVSLRDGLKNTVDYYKASF